MQVELLICQICNVSLFPQLANLIHCFYKRENLALTGKQMRWGEAKIRLGENNAEVYNSVGRNFLLKHSIFGIIFF